MKHKNIVADKLSPFSQELQTLSSIGSTSETCNDSEELIELQLSRNSFAAIMMLVLVE